MYMKRVILFVSLVMMFVMAQAQSKNEGQKSKVVYYTFQFDYTVNNTSGEFNVDQVYVTIIDEPGEKPKVVTSGVFEGHDEIEDEVDPTVVYWKSKNIVYLYGTRWTYAFAEVEVAGLDKCVLYLMKKDGSSDFSRVNKSGDPGPELCVEAMADLHQSIRNRSFHNYTVKVQE